MKPTRIVYQFNVKITCSWCGRISPKLLNTRKGARVLNVWDCACGAHYVVNLQTPAKLKIDSQRSEDGTKICRKCGLSKPFKEFQKDTGKPSGYRSACKTCMPPSPPRASRASEQAAWKKKNPEKVRQYRRTHLEKQRKAKGLST